MKKTAFVPALCVALLLAACGDCEQETSWKTVGEESLDAAQKTQRAAAFEAKDALFQQLSSELMAAIREKGPAEAIGVCRTQAPDIAARVSEEKGLAIGRTSFQLRNTANVPPAWAAALVEAKHAENAYRVAPDGTLGVLLPIRLQNACLTCHGEEAAVAAEVQARIRDLYPDDAAMGFAQGDLRGYFWVEVPRAGE